jgi:hypothetical protein
MNLSFIFGPLACCVPSFFTESDILSHWLDILQLSEEKKLDLLKNIAESSPHVTAQDARQLLPSILQLLKVDICFSSDYGL